MIRHRRVQAVVIALLAALVTACACVAPIYDRAIQQASFHTQLRHRDATSLALTLTSNGSGAPAPAKLARQPGPQIRRFFGKPVEFSRMQKLQKYGVRAEGVKVGVGDALASTSACPRLRFVAGHCPRGFLDAAISQADAKTFGWRVGQRVPVVDRSDSSVPAVKAEFRIVGVYAAPKGHDAALPTTGYSGQVGGPPGVLTSDDWLVAPSTVTGAKAPAWLTPFNTARLPLDEQALQLDDLAPLSHRIKRLGARLIAASYGIGGLIRTSSGLPDVARVVARARDQAQVTVPLFVVQLALLGAVVFWLVLGAATEQRRPEVALARLRGRGPAGARALLLGELAPIGVAGVVVGGGVAVALSFVIRRWVLPGNAPFELRAPFWLVLGGALLLVLASVWVAVARVVREPLFTLLRRVPARRTGWALGIADALVVAAAAVAVAAFVSGTLTGPLAQVAPTLLALLVGLVLAHVLVPTGAWLGGRLASGRRVGLGVGLLQLARRTSTRRVVALLTVATALLVFAADAYQVGARNRQYAAEQQVGAPLVATLGYPDLAALTGALAEVDPSGRRATPVVTIPTAGNEDRATVTVLPQDFRRVALFPGSDPSSIPWRKLAPPDVPPLRIVGNRIGVRVSGVTEHLGGESTTVNTPLELSLRYNGSDGISRMVHLGTLPVPGKGPHTVRVVRPHRMRADLLCGDGCVITGVVLDAGAGQVATGNVTLSDLTTSSGQHPSLGPATRWYPSKVTDPSNGEVTGYLRTAQSQGDGSGDGLALEFDTTGLSHAVLGSSWVPARLPAVITGTLAGGDTTGPLSSPGLDAIERPMHAVGDVARVPGSPVHTRLVNLDVLRRDGTELDPNDRLQVWFAHDDPALLHRLTEELRHRSVEVASTTRLTEVRRGLDQSAPAWGLLLAVLVGAAGLVIAGLVLFVVSATVWRTRARDLAALRMTGLTRGTVRRVALAEQLPLVVLAVVAGAVCGVVGASFSLPSVPLLPVTPDVSTLDTATAWTGVLAAGIGALVVLGVVGWLAGRALARRATLDRVREEV